jgi:F-type H+-transporting ATPase subunit gamma
MATLREVRNRITGVKKTQKITRAMKMVAAAKLRRAQGAVVAARPYAQNMSALLRQLVQNVDPGVSPLFANREVRRAAVVVITSDRGLCGAFNSNLVRSAAAHMATRYPGFREEERIKLFCVGKKGFDFFTRRHYVVAGRYLGVYSDLVFAQAQNIAREVVESFLKGETDCVDLVYNEFKSVAKTKIVVERFLPMSIEIGPDDSTTHGKPVDYLYEPSTEEIVRSLLPRHLNFQIWKAMLESNAAEQGARMSAMENATENASEMISLLQLVYNKARQAAITKELLEVVGGAEALKKTA